MSKYYSVCVLCLLFGFFCCASFLQLTNPAANYAIGNDAPSSPVSEPSLQELKTIVMSQQTAWNRGDIDAFMVGYWNNEQLTFSSGGETARGWNRTLERYKSKYPDRETMGRLTFSELETYSLGSDSALMLGNWRLEREQPVSGNFSLVWKRLDGKWLIIHDHSSAKP
jgi:ketosteroid isomerase-like protein